MVWGNEFAESIPHRVDIVDVDTEVHYAVECVTIVPTRLTSHTGTKLSTK